MSRFTQSPSPRTVPRSAHAGEGREVLYISFDGLASPLGYSQVVRPVCALADRGFRYRIVSFENDSVRADDGVTERVRGRLNAAGVTWDALSYGTNRAANVGRAVQHVLRGRPPALVHARSYLSAVVALCMKLARGVPYLFDTRGYWIDERLDARAWFTNDLSLSLARTVEKRLYRNAAATVMLTDVAASDVRHHLFGRWTGTPVVCIPTLVDFDDFEFRFGAPIPAEARHLQDRLVLGYVGAQNSAYRIDETLAIVRQVLAERPDAHFLCLTLQRDEMLARLRAAGIAPIRTTVRSVSHDRVAGWLRVMDWAFVLREDTFANRAAMPTKLGELFATGIHPVVWGGNEDLRAWVQRAETGLLLSSLDDERVAVAAREIVSRDIDETPLRRARARARKHFGLMNGIDLYSALLTELLAHDCRRRN
jgi:glycosyltransferase involved in cell wall biosynthesis